MKNLIQLISLCLFIATATTSMAQDSKDKARKKAEDAIKLMDNGSVDESLVLLEEAQKLDPEAFDYPYEIAYAYYLKKNYKGAIKVLEKIETHKDVTNRLYQLLGNSYDNLGKRDKAIEVYERGLKKFPGSGPLYLELGIVHLYKNEFIKALEYYELGIKSDPKFTSNYYWAAKIYCNSSEEVWGMIYGEIFMNMERNSKRTSEISKMLYDTYKKEIQIINDSSMSVSFSKNSAIDVSDIDEQGNIQLPYGIGVYEPTIMTSLVMMKPINMTTLNELRSNFTKTYQEKHSEKYPNILFAYQQKVKEAGHLEAYNYWILMKGNEEEFDAWHSENKTKWESFIKWFAAHPMKVDQESNFHTSQYR